MQVIECYPKSYIDYCKTTEATMAIVLTLTFQLIKHRALVELCIDIILLVKLYKKETT